ncbi:serine protease 1-like [Hetaerina americana]|uniref:serine protease 1-like n=1 Tax=Hetaerina americana TaxID=62018 RepID=UPI003A7F4043
MKLPGCPNAVNQEETKREWGTRAQDITVYLGAHNRAIGDEKLRLKAERVIRHPEYSPRTFINDVALIKVNNKIKFTNGLCSVCLPNENTAIGEGVEATITGWGNTSPYNLMYPTVLMKAVVNIVSQENCSAAYAKSIPPSQICAAAPGKDSCQGDSGGPMVVESDGTWQLIGITSWGRGCANPKYPGVYTNVVMFVPWIQNNSQDCGQQCSN